MMSNSLPLIALAAAAFLLVIVLLVAVSRPNGVTRRGRALGRRLDGAPRSRAESPGMESVKRTGARSLPVIEELARRLLPRQALLRERLERSGLRASVGHYLVACVLCGGCAAAAVATSFRVPVAALLAVGIVGGLGVPHLAVGFLASRRRARFTALLPDAIDLIVRGLKAGLPIVESMRAVGREISDPVGAEFRAMTDAIRFGRMLSDVLWATARKLDIQEFNFFVISLSIQQETGGNLAETLANLSKILRQRKQMKLKIKALSSEARASAYILGALPFLMFGVIHTMNPGYAEQLFDDPRGNVMLAAGLLSIALGSGVMAKMVRFEI